MTNQPPNLQSIGDLPTRSFQSDEHVSLFANASQYEDTSRKSFQGQPHPHIAHGTYPTTHYNTAQQQAFQVRRDSSSIGELGYPLTGVTYQSYGNLPNQRYRPVATPSQQLYQMQNMPRFATSQSRAGQTPTAVFYDVQYQAQYLGIHAPDQIPSPPNFQSGMNAESQMCQGQGYVGQGQQRQPAPPYLIQPSQYTLLNQIFMGPAAVGEFAIKGAFEANNRGRSQLRVFGPLETFGQSLQQRLTGNSADNASAIPSVVRGPPRKPRQSGYAIWIGNLPPQTDLMSLVLHVCKEAPGLESLFLISKSNCAFANFKVEASCTTAQMKIHNSEFQTVRLVSRLPRSSNAPTVPGAAPTGPASGTASESTRAQDLTPESEAKPVEAPVTTKVGDTRGAKDINLPKDKFFIVKSLTVEDLELSVRNGIWATQSHNEEALNKAYQTTNNVYLVFSANKSGEYFGYAKMTSPINDDPAAAIKCTPKAQMVQDLEMPKAISTPATEFAPQGRIIDDSARGAIFWEVERKDDGEKDEEYESGSNRSGDGAAPPSKAWCKPFQVIWISTTRLPFYRTRGLRNPWNSNREVKIARDGTELETAIGRRLLALFHIMTSPVAPASTQGMPLPLVDGYPQQQLRHHQR